MISTMTPMTPAAAYPAAAAAPKTAVHAATLLWAQDTSVLVQVGSPVLSAADSVLATGLTIAEPRFRGGDAPVQGPPSRGTPV